MDIWTEKGFAIIINTSYGCTNLLPHLSRFESISASNWTLILTHLICMPLYNGKYVAC